MFESLGGRLSSFHSHVDKMITVAIGLFFLLLAVLYAILARKNYIAAQKQPTPAVKARGRIAVIFALVGLGLVMLGLLNR